jgi:hypothetical protein
LTSGFTQLTLNFTRSALNPNDLARDFSRSSPNFNDQSHPDIKTTFHVIKAKFGERMRSKSATGQVNEVLCKVLCHNLCCVIQSIYELGVEPPFWTHESNAQ